MQHLRSLDHVQLHSTWVTIGSFDGVHRGHQALVKSLVEQAHQAGSPALVITFFPHPAVVLRNISDPFYLTSPDERAELLSGLGVDYLITLPFSRELAAVSAGDFMQMLSSKLGLRNLWVGSDFALGRNREGDVPHLRQIGETLDFDVQVVEPVLENGEVISSSQIRAALSSGNVAEAARLLGRWYSITGEVVHGDGRGHSLGIPTANLSYWSQRLLPAFGIYANWVIAGEQRLPAVSNVGVRPMFLNPEIGPQVEAHILDFSQDLYGQVITVEFVEYLRSEQKYDSVDDLLAQIQKDIQKTREVLQHAR
jgi:riboflavin kinase / FMN adenylyltransferase